MKPTSIESWEKKKHLFCNEPPKKKNDLKNEKDWKRTSNISIQKNDLHKRLILLKIWS